MGAVAGSLSGVLVPLVLACAFRKQRTRSLLVWVADWVLAFDDKVHKSRPT